MYKYAYGDSLTYACLHLHGSGYQISANNCFITRLFGNCKVKLFLSSISSIRYTIRHQTIDKEKHPLRMRSHKHTNRFAENSCFYNP